MSKVKSKKAQAMAIFKTMQRRKNAPTPKEVKERFVERVGMTTRQAATYYHNIASGKWS